MASSCWRLVYAWPIGLAFVIATLLAQIDHRKLH